MTDLVFQSLPVVNGDLVFGELDTPTTNATCAIDAAFPGLTASVRIDESTLVNVSGTFSGLTASVRIDESVLVNVNAAFPGLTASVAVVAGRDITISAAFPELTASVAVSRVTELDIAAAFPELTASVYVAPSRDATISAAFPELTASFEVNYDVNVSRPTVGSSATPWRVAAVSKSGVLTSSQVATKFPSGWTDETQLGTLSIGGFEHRLPSVFVPDVTQHSAPIQEGTLQSANVQDSAQDADRSIRTLDVARFKDGTPIRSQSAQRHQDGDHSKRAWRKVRYQSATHLKGRTYTGRPKSGTKYIFGRDTRFQDGRVPPAGISFPPVPLPPQPINNGTHLLFQDMWPVTTALVFGNGRDTIPLPVGLIVVQQREVYIMVNDATLRRVEGNINLPVISMSLSLDVDSWTWGFNASLPGSTLPNLEPSTMGAPVEVEASINGQVYRALVEGISRSREFGKSDIRVSGRGKTALLDAPYSPVMTFGNLADDRTAQQLVIDVLTLNGVGIGWDVNWGLTDWLVPMGVFTHQGTYISAINDIAQSVGGYLQPDPSAQAVKILARYPTLPWDWGTTDIDYELPSNVTTREAIEWQEKARYNRVYVSGVQQGVIGQVTRYGTAGDLLAPMATHPLITHADAARQRGGAILAQTGRIANVNLRLPVLNETGIITPGKMVRYVDGGNTRVGIVRSVAVDVGFPEIWQSIGVETHVN